MQSNGGLARRRRPRGYHAASLSLSRGWCCGSHALASNMQLAHVFTFDMGGTFARHRCWNTAITPVLSTTALAGASCWVQVGPAPAIDCVCRQSILRKWVQVAARSCGWTRWHHADWPEERGRDAGPVCYDQGGTEPTVTTPMVLGYLNQEYLVGGELKIDASRSRDALKEKVADPLNPNWPTRHMCAPDCCCQHDSCDQAVPERGRDPRQYTLFAFGGNGPLFAATMARTLGMSRY